MLIQVLQVLLEGLGLGVLLVLVCAIGIRKGAVEWCIYMTLQCRHAVWNWD